MQSKSQKAEISDASGAPGVSEIVIQDLTAEEISALPTHQRNVVTARHFGRSYKVIASDLGIPLGTVRSRINRARQAILKSRSA